MAPILTGLTLEDVPELVALLKTVPPDLKPGLLWREFLPAWAALDGKAAFVFGITYDAAHAAAVDAMDQWMRTRPGEPDRYLQTIQNEDERRFQARYMAGAWLRRDPGEAMEQATRPVDPVIRESTILHVARTVMTHPAHRDPDLLARWLRGLVEDDAALGAVGFLAGAWAAEDPKRTVAWAESLPSGAVRAEAYHQMVGSWAGVDPGAAGDWLSRNLGNPDADRAVIEYALLAASDDPETARSWIARVTSPDLRDRALKEMEARLDPDAAPILTIQEWQRRTGCRL